jgi:hypothetical protein
VKDQGRFVRYDDLPSSAKPFSRRQLLFGAGAAVALTTLAACDPVISRVPPTETSRPTPTREPYQGPPLKSTRVETYPSPLDKLTIFSLDVNFDDVTQLVAQQQLKAPLQVDKTHDWFGPAEVVDTRNIYQQRENPQKTPTVWVYFSNQEQKYYKGFQNDGKDAEILGWKPDPSVSEPITTNIPGTFGYTLHGIADSPEKAFVFVDIHKGKKTFLSVSGFQITDITLSKNAKVIAVNNPPDGNKKSGIFLFDTKPFTHTQTIPRYVQNIALSEDAQLIHGINPSVSGASIIIDTQTHQEQFIGWPVKRVWNDRVILSPHFRYAAVENDDRTKVFGPMTDPKVVVRTPEGEFKVIRKRFFSERNNRRWHTYPC